MSWFEIATTSLFKLMFSFISRPYHLCPLQTKTSCCHHLNLMEMERRWDKCECVIIPTPAGLSFQFLPPHEKKPCTCMAKSPWTERMALSVHPQPSSQRACSLQPETSSQRGHPTPTAAAWAGRFKPPRHFRTLANHAKQRSLWWDIVHCYWLMPTG